MFPCRIWVYTVPRVTVPGNTWSMLVHMALVQLPFLGRMDYKNMMNDHLLCTLCTSYYTESVVPDKTWSMWLTRLSVE